MQYKNLMFIGIVSTFLGWGAVATAAEPTLAESLPGIEARINFENKQVVRQQNSNQYMQLLSVRSIKQTLSIYIGSIPLE